MNDDEDKIELTLTGEVSFRQNITKSQAGQIIAFLGAQSQAQSTSPNYSTPTLMPTATSSYGFETPRTAIEGTKAKTNPEKIVALAAYVLQEGSRDTFSTEDIKPLFKRSGEITPKNFGRDLIAATKAGYIDESEQRGEYYLTKKAKNALENGFEPKSSSSKQNKRSTRRSTKSNVQNISDEIKNIEAITVIPEYPGFYELKTKSDKFLWVLALAKKYSIVSLTSSEIAFISDAIGEGIPSNDVNSYFRLNQKKGFVNKTLQDNKIRITPTGEVFLKSQSSESGRD